MAKNRVELLIYGPIFDSESNPNSSRRIAQFLLEHKDADEIVVRINSPGGNPYSGMAIHNSLKNHKAKVIAHIDGMAASAASLIPMGADEVHINSCAQMMIHNPSNLVWGDEHAMRKEADNLAKLKESVMNAYLSKVKISKDELIRVLDEETTYTAEEALQCGLATHIVEEVVREGVVMYSEPLNSKNFEEYMNTFQQKIKMVQPPIKKETDIMTLTMEKLKSDNPTLYNQILEEGKREERTRLQALDTISVPGSEELVNKAKYETMETKAEVCLAIVDQGLPTAQVQTVETPIAPQAPTDTVTMLNTGKKPLPGEETPPNLEETNGFEGQMKAGNRLAELYNRGR